MKLFIGFFAFILVVNLAASLPARLPQDDAEVFSGPRRVITNRGAAVHDDDDDSNQSGFRGVITSDVGYPFLQPSPHAFSFNWGYFDTLEDMLRRLKARLHGIGQSDSSSDDSGSELGSTFLNDKNKVNSTSTVKVVDGHKIEINDTFYGNSNSLFKVRLVKIRPLDDDEEAPAEGTITSGGNEETKPSTSNPFIPEDDAETDDDTREPLAKNPTDNEINGNIHDPENKSKSSDAPLSETAQIGKISENIENIEKSEKSEEIEEILSKDDSIDKLNAAFILDKSHQPQLDQPEYSEEPEQVELDIEDYNYKDKKNQEIDVYGNIEAETNKKSHKNPKNTKKGKDSSLNKEFKHLEAFEDNKMENYETDDIAPAIIDEQPNNYNSDLNRDSGSSSISHVGHVDNGSGSLTIENNEETEQNDNLNDSSPQNYNDENTMSNTGDGKNNNAAMQLTSTLADPNEKESNQNNNNNNNNNDNDNDNNNENDEDENENGEVFDVNTNNGESTKEILEEDTDIDEEQALADVENIEEIYVPNNKEKYNSIYKKERESLASSSDDEEYGPEAVEMNPTFNAEWSDLVETLASANDANNNLDNEIDVYDTVPVNLSNDIAVNEWAASQVEHGNYPLNPDAEFIENFDPNSNNNDSLEKMSIPKFEKLSISPSMTSPYFP